jgi:hypothetical protein
MTNEIRTVARTESAQNQPKRSYDDTLTCVLCFVLLVAIILSKAKARNLVGLKIP